MIKVSCPSCSASYDVDEHRLPEEGLRMRCPQCGESFQVHRDGSTGKAVSTPPRRAAKRPRRKTQVGLGPPSDLPKPVSLPPLEDLPAPKAGGESLDFDPFEDVGGNVDLPAPKEQPESSGFDPFAGLDLPAPMEPAGGADLPAPMHTQGGVDLPAPKGSTEVDLPAPMGRDAMGEEVDLPMALTDAELPAPIEIGDSDLPMPSEHRDLPVARDDFMDLDVEGPQRTHGGGPVELDLPDGDDLALEMDVDQGVKPPAPPPPLGRGFDAQDAPPAAAEMPPSGERISRDSAELELPESHALEFSELPDAAQGGVQRMPHPGGEPGAARARAKRTIDVKALASKRPPWLIKAVAAVVGISVVLGAGFYLGSTKYGLFGVHLVEPFLPASGDAVEVAQSIQQAEATAASDTYAATRHALTQLEGARSEARLNRTLVARSLLHESYYQARYGQEAEGSRKADELRLHLQRRGDEAPGVHLALAADALRNTDLSTATSEIALASSEGPPDVYVDLVSGEIALKGSDGQAAVDAFEQAMKKDETARAEWGLARAYRILGDRDKALQAAKETLRMSPDHAAARVVVAEALIADGELDAAYASLEAPAGLAEGDAGAQPVARADRSAALALMARIEEHRGRLGAAREMYEKAVELDASNAHAALGAARLVLLEGGYADALARFQTVIGSTIPPGAEQDPTGKPKVLVQAKLGAAEALVAMEKAGDAKAMLVDLQTPEPVNADVEIWQGKVADALGESIDAVRHFRNAIKLEPNSFRAYMALAQHYSATKRPGEAVAVLVEAQQSVEITAEVRRLLGEAELQRNRVDAAITQFQAALEMEPLDSSAQFGLAIAYRRKGQLEEAAAALAKVEEQDAKYPGLPLEKGRLAEASGDVEGAVASYRQALKEAPSDIALKSRLGAALTITGQLDEGEAFLREVLKVRPYSAEAEHYLGRVDMDRGNLEGARQHFLRAARLEPERGLYRMYVGWAALESHEMTTALRDFDAALKRDPNLGDAYWLRARIRIRAGAVRDALTDLQKAIELNPSRMDAWAAIGECQYQLGQTKEAIAAFKKAVEGDPERGYWWYRLGRLELDEGKREQALTSLSTAIGLGDAAEGTPAWMADAHRLLGDIYYATRKRQEAIVHYGRYLELSPPNAIDRSDVESKLQKIGATTY